MGICGGYQMLGMHLCDPKAVETTIGEADGFGLLATSTELHPEKQLKQVHGRFKDAQFNNAQVKGYEIHCGVTTPVAGEKPPKPLLSLDNNSHDGAINDDNNILGTYLHGIFDSPASCDAILQWAGLDRSQSVNVADVREHQLERLADCLEEHLNVDFLDRISRIPN